MQGTNSKEDESDLAQAALVEEATSKAISLVEQYADLDPDDASPDNPWRDPMQILKQLDQAREAVQAAWTANRNPDDQAAAAAADNNTTSTNSKLDEAKFRALYVDMITDSFADCLEEMRQKEGENLDVDILVDCLQSGLDLLSTAEAELLVQDNEVVEAMDDSETSLTPHQARRRQLGLDVAVS